ncbi:MAG: B12-binding domain-containing radical SAM protein [Desulfovibrionaceae bacterium]|nr:B12-binding domain-containing radical SAM protein [Desulfovibrionaceae bacterium]
MKIDFYYITTNKVRRPVIYNEGVAVLSALARERGAETSLQRVDLADYRNAAFSVDPEADVHAVSFASQQHSLAYRVVAEINARRGRGIIIVGGVHATVARDEVAAMPGVDLVVSGEGEQAMQRLLDNPAAPLEGFDLPNCHLPGRPLAPLTRTEYVDLNSLPLPDRSIFERPLLREKPEFIFSRGCPFSCRYCANEFFNKTFGFKMRRKTPEYALAELENAFSTLDIAPDTLLIFHDDVFILDLEWLESFGALFRKRFKNPFRCNTIAKAMTEDKARLLRDMNCVEVWVGIESGDEAFRRRVLNKQVSDQEIVRAFELIDRYGLKGVSFNLFGCPGETIENLKRTFELNKRCKVYNTSTSIFYPFPGTSLYDQETARGNVRELSDEENDSGVSVFALKDYQVSRRDYFYYAKLLQSYVNHLRLEHYGLRLLKALGVDPLGLKDFLQGLPVAGRLLERYKARYYLKSREK